MKDLKDLCRNVCRNWTYRVSNAGAVFLNVVLMLKDFRLFWCHLWFVVVTEAEEQLVFMCFQHTLEKFVTLRAESCQQCFLTKSTSEYYKSCVCTGFHVLPSSQVPFKMRMIQQLYFCLHLETNTVKFKGFIVETDYNTKYTSRLNRLYLLTFIC